MIKILSLLWLLAPAALAAPIDPCDGGERQGLWLLTVNQDDASQRDELLETLRLLASPGFLPTFVMAPAGNPAVVIGVSFDTTRFRAATAAAAAKDKVLAALAAIPGNELECNDFSLPGMGIRN
jgi:hypothetical protein